MLPRTLQEFFDELELQPEDPGRLILPTDRSAAAFRGAYNARQQQRGRSAWEPAPALSWKQWTMSLWSELIVQGNEERLLLNTSQEHALWCEVIREHAGSVPTLGSVDALADLAAEAFQLVASHNALHRLRSSAQSHDSRIFAEWAEAFRRSCIANNCISASLLEQAVTQHIERDKLAAPSTFTLVGFLEQSPAQELLLAACEQKGTTIRRSRFAPAAGIPLTRRSMILPTEREELRHAALWAGEHLRNHHGAEPPRLAIILPSGEEDRAMLEQALRSILTPELESIHADLSSTPWAFSSGPALATEPIVLAALTIARWAGHPLPIDLISALLLSPYIAANADAKQRAASARFDATVLRRTPRLRDEMTVEQVLALGADRRDNAAARTTAPAVLERLRDVQHVIERAGALDRQRSFAEWTSFLRDLLSAAQWPGDRPLNASEFEATRAWDGLLDTMATLDFQGRRVPLTTALQELERQARAATFHPASADPPLQIMALSESISQSFDAVLVLRATDANLPVTERPHPLLSWTLQRSLDMPGSAAARSTDRTRLMLDDLFGRSGDVLFTLAAENADGPLRPTAFIETCGLKPIASMHATGAQQIAPEVGLEIFADTEPLPPLPPGPAFGGAKVLELQAACGFLAFAALRLRAAELDVATLGLDLGESGSLLHRALEAFWGEVKSQDALRALPEEDRRTLLAASIDRNWPHRVAAESEWDLAYVSMMKERLLDLLSQWLRQELLRGPFEVLDTESRQQLAIGPLKLDLRIDRIDRIADEDGTAGFVLVDYKSGIAGEPKEWEGERPIQPQLPLYGLLSDATELKGLAFAKVRAGDGMHWHGIQAEDGILPRSPKSRRNPTREMSDLLEEWRTSLTQLAEDFAAGRADVRPRDFNKDCARCVQRLLCRVDPRALRQNDPGESADDEATDRMEEIDG